MEFERLVPHGVSSARAVRWDGLDERALCAGAERRCLCGSYSPYLLYLLLSSKAPQCSTRANPEEPRLRMQTFVDSADYQTQTIIRPLFCISIQSRRMLRIILTLLSHVYRPRYSNHA